MTWLQGYKLTRYILLKAEGGSLQKKRFYRLWFSCCFSFLFLCNSTIAAPNFTENKLSAEKLSYCERLTKRLGHKSWERNSSWSDYVRISRVDSSKWRRSQTEEPGWFLDELKVWYEAPESSNSYYRHRALCKWEENGDFEFLIEVWNLGYVVECALPDYSGHSTCP